MILRYKTYTDFIRRFIFCFSDRKKVIDVPKDCSNGSVIWQYPKSSIDLVFLPHGSKTTFEACIGHIVDKTIWEINEIINGKPEKLQFPKQGKWAVRINEQKSPSRPSDVSKT